MWGGLSVDSQVPSEREGVMKGPLSEQGPTRER